MNVKNHIASLLENFQLLNAFSFQFSYTDSSISTSFELEFDIPAQTALIYSVLNSMLIQGTVVYLIDSKTIKILVFNA